MDRSREIILVSEEEIQDDTGVPRKQTTERKVFCQVDSVTRSEFFDAGRSGLNPELRFTMFFGDYLGERTLIYEGRSYGVYRTYQGKNDTIELYAERKGGTNGF